MSLGSFNTLPPRPEHLVGVRTALATGELLTPSEVAKRAGLTLTQARCALEHMEARGDVRVVRQLTTPKIRVALSTA